MVMLRENGDQTAEDAGLWLAGMGRTPGELPTKPRADQVLDLLKSNRSYFTGFHAACRKTDDYFHGRIAVPVPEGHAQLRTATARALINIATDHVDVGNIAIDVPPPSPRARARAERIKKFLLGFWLTVRDPVLRTAARQGFGYGITFLKPMFDADRWPAAPRFDQYEDEAAYRVGLQDFLEARRIHFPFVVRNVSPRNIVWDDSRARMKWAIEFYEAPASEMARMFPEWRSGKQGNDIASWLEYWDEHWMGYMADGDWVWGPYPHGYGALPYVPVQLGNTMTYDSDKPEERYQGLLVGNYEVIDAKARVFAAYEAILRQFGWRTMDFMGTNVAAADKTRQDYEMFGGKNLIQPGVEVKASPMVAPPPELLQFANVLENELEAGTFPNVVRGMRPSGVSTGFAISVLAGMGRLVFQGMADGLSRAIEGVNTRVLQLVENKAMGSVTVHARSRVHNFDQTIGPNDIRGIYENRVSLKAEAPEEREREALLAMNLWNNGMGIISMYEAQVRAGVANPLEEQMVIEAERLLGSPNIRAVKEQLAARGLGLMQQLAQVVDQTNQMAEGAGGSFNRGQFGPFGTGPRPGEAAIQEQRVQSKMASDNMPTVYPQGMGGIALLGKKLGTAQGGATRMPSGQTVR